jgi:hypothetical protein
MINGPAAIPRAAGSPHTIAEKIFPPGQGRFWLVNKGLDFRQ